MEILQDIDFSPLFISIKTGIVATIIAFLLGILAARFVMKLGEKTKWIIDSILTLPLVLPPTVAGFFLLLIFSIKRPIGHYLWVNMGIKVVLSWIGCVIAATVISFPLMYRNARSAFEQVDTNMILAGRTLGMSEGEIFWRIIMPIAKPGIASGAVLTFARAIGEYGATSMLAGNILGKTQTIALAIASEVSVAEFSKAGFWVVVILILSFFIVMLINLIGNEKGKRRGGWKI